MVASGPADDPCPTGLGCCSCPMDFSSAFSGQERSTEPEGERVREAGLCVPGDLFGDNKAYGSGDPFAEDLSS